ncbi:MAG: ABC-F family ATP-binding cassette domain-containing protein [Desulfobulbaceae bacterium]|nr:ABC-F family ATP-binding cassette domain-containing protein [Desulfobulbaceae bacterium]
MLTVNNLNLQYGGKHLFRDVSAQVHPDDRIGLIGVNGTGKSTLLKIMSGLQETDPGTVNRASWFTVAYLPQEVTVSLGSRSLYEEAETAFQDVLNKQEELREVSEQLAVISSGDPELEPLLQRQGDLQHFLEGRDIFTIRPQIERILGGLGFSQADLKKEVRSFSGGWIMRLLLAKLLLQKPALLLLDEPTNHLDLDSLTWLEDFLRQYQGAIIVISHDRSFLDRLTTSTWELSLGRLTVYRGNYSKYLVEKEERLEIERAAYNNQQAKIKQTERFITRFRAKSTKAKQVQSRVRQLEKMERIELSETERSIRFTFPPAAPSGKQVLELRGLNKSFDHHPVFKDINLSLNRGDRLAVVGVNGAGKTTLMKIIAGMEPAEGEVRLGHNVILSYFGQHQAQELSGELTVLDTVYHGAEDMTMTRVRSLLGAFLFTGDEVDKKVQILSGGEKSRVALARMLVTPANLMLLDEPTNHLDISSQEVLQEAMAQYEGTIIVVSHNRFFANSFVNKVLEIRDGRATIYEGNVDDYLERRKKEQAGNKPAETETVPEEDAAGAGINEQPADRKTLRRERALMREKLGRKLTPLKDRVRKTEEQIQLLETRKQELESVMADPELYRDQEKWAEVSREYAGVAGKLERNYAQWEEVQEMIEAIEGSAVE